MVTCCVVLHTKWGGGIFYFERQGLLRVLNTLNALQFTRVRILINASWEYGNGNLEFGKMGIWKMGNGDLQVVTFQVHVAGTCHE